SPLVRELFAETNPIPVKEAMHLRGRGGPRVRSPLSRLSEDRRESLRELLAAYDERAAGTLDPTALDLAATEGAE
ncbi:4-hydroxy-tetrahydrodipicolinate synthase, partial [Halorubrum ezzemoulense]